jgi:hypothetical protein
MAKIYKQIKKTGIIPQEYSYKLDFGVPMNVDLFREEFVKLYQATLFRPYEQKANREKNSQNLLTSSPYKAIGITPEEGISLPLKNITSYTDFIDQSPM